MAAPRGFSRRRGVVQEEPHDGVTFHHGRRITDWDQALMWQPKGGVGVISRADGSALFEMGNTRVIAVVYGPESHQHSCSCCSVKFGSHDCILRFDILFLMAVTVIHGLMLQD
ncbi:Exosome complex exonuclease RRP41 [Hordeum vulgare]|nr:Exosome complex exonuclease RRP41 [Hordeum vulgare]